MVTLQTVLQVYTTIAPYIVPVTLAGIVAQVVKYWPITSYKRKRRKLKDQWLRMFYTRSDGSTYTTVISQNDNDDGSFSVEIDKKKMRFVYDPNKIFIIPRGIPLIYGERCLWYHSSDATPIDFQKGSPLSTITPKKLAELVDHQLISELLTLEKDDKEVMKWGMIIVIVIIAFVVGMKLLGN